VIPAEDDSAAATALMIIFKSLMPLATSGSVGLARTCTALAEKGLLTEADIISISFDALRPFDSAFSEGPAELLPVTKSLERLRQHLEAEWDKATRAAYYAKKEGRKPPP